MNRQCPIFCPLFWTIYFPVDLFYFLYSAMSVQISDRESFVVVSFQFNRAIVEFIQALPTRVFDKNNKTWSFPKENLEEFINFLDSKKIKFDHFKGPNVCDGSGWNKSPANWNWNKPPSWNQFNTQQSRAGDPSYQPSDIWNQQSRNGDPCFQSPAMWNQPPSNWNWNQSSQR